VQPAAKRARTVDKLNAAYLPKGIAPFSNLIGWEVRNIFILLTIPRSQVHLLCPL
jgi:hypothetical protein